MQKNKKKQIVIWWAGPAWLTFAYEILSRSDDFDVIILERFDRVWGISTTIEHHGNKMDIWWHRFFSKSKRVMDRRFKMMPLQWSNSYDYKQIWINSKIQIGGPDPDKEDVVMLSRRRLSRIFWNNKFFDYPLTISFSTIRNLWWLETIKIWLSYISSKFQKFDTTNLEWFYKSRFGTELYNKFFKNYTRNVWWVDPKDIPSEWWAQRVKWLSLTSAVWDYFKKLFTSKQTTETETSLIWSFYYPKYGPWQMRQIVSDKVSWLWGNIIKWAEIVWSRIEDNKIVSIKYMKNSVEHTLEPDYFISTLAIKDLLKTMTWADKNIVLLSSKLMYRDFVTVWVLVDKLAISNDGRFASINNCIPDNWIYVHDDRLKVGRIQIFNNRSPYMLWDTRYMWIWLEYFCDEDTDKIYNSSDGNIIDIAKKELTLLWLTDTSTDYIDFKVVRYDKTYPSYFGEWYKNFAKIRSYVDGISNLFLIWRNGMHRYNNQDHSMLCGMELADMLLSGNIDKSTLREINTERSYHEEQDK